MSKKYKGKICVYCTKAKSSTPDHVFARKFFLKSDRNHPDPLIVPVCKRCNNEKSELETYLMGVLPFGGRHAAAKENLELVPPRLEKNRKLHRELADGQERVWVRENGIYVETMTVPTDPARIEKLFSLIARGLVWKHWQTLLKSDDPIRVEALTEVGARLRDAEFSGLGGVRHVQRNLGNGTICYEGKQVIEMPELTVWRIVMYGGLTFVDPQGSGETSSLIWVMTGINSLQSKNAL